jgi:hypothetical protein
MFHLSLAMADALLAVVFLYAFFRSQWERGFRARYTLKAILPNTLAALAFGHFALVFGQMAVDLNNALVHTIWAAQLPGVAGPSFPWQFPLNNEFGFPLFELIVRLAIVLFLVILAITYVLRFAVLAILLSIAPLAALCLVLPETKIYARAWNKVFLVTVFMQFGQVLVLRLASVLMTEMRGNPIQAIYGLVVLYLVVKVPGLMHASSHIETKGQHLLFSSGKKAWKAALATGRAATS